MQRLPYRCRRRLYRWGLLALVVGSWVVASYAAQESQDVINATTAFQIDGLSSRLTDLERADLGVRVAKLEESMGEVRWLARGVMAAVMGQLVIGLMDRKQVRASDRRG